MDKEISNFVLDCFDDNSFFVEAGGSHPIVQNNTFELEKNGWKGLVIEPRTDYNEQYSIIRPNTILENYILVSENYKLDEIEADISHDMVGGVINNYNTSSWNPVKHRCTTLGNLFSKHNITEVNFLSLDVEGYEKEVLEGINFEKVFIHLICVEVHYIPLYGGLTNFDYLKNFGFTKIKIVGGNIDERHNAIYLNNESPLYEKIKNL